MIQRHNINAQKMCFDGETYMQAMRKTDLMDRLAHSLGEARARLREEIPAAISLDLRLPDGQGGFAQFDHILLSRASRTASIVAMGSTPASAR